MPSINLPDILNQCAGLLRSIGETYWSAKLANVASRAPLSSRDASEVLSWFGSMGSFNDLVVSSLNGHPVDPREEGRINARLDLLRRTIFEAANTLAR